MPIQSPPYHGETSATVTITGTFDGEKVDRRYSDTGYLAPMRRWQELFGLEAFPVFGPVADRKPINIVEYRERLPTP